MELRGLSITVYTRQHIHKRIVTLLSKIFKTIITSYDLCQDILYTVKTTGYEGGQRGKAEGGSVQPTMCVPLLASCLNSCASSKILNQLQAESTLQSPATNHSHNTRNHLQSIRNRQDERPTDVHR